MTGWRVVRRAGDAGALHADEPVGAGRDAAWLDVTAPALILGSAQPGASVDDAAAAAAGIAVVRRRSGGGAVLMLPGESLWLDVVVPVGDPRWHDDVGRAMWWLGEAWAAALASLGIDADVHRGPLVRTAWSPLVCFDGIGAGEVLVDGAKAVGVSQRRTRGWARLQSSVHLAWRPELMVSLLAEPRPAVTDLHPVWTWGGPAGDLVAAVEAELAQL